MNSGLPSVSCRSRDAARPRSSESGTESVEQLGDRQLIQPRKREAFTGTIAAQISEKFSKRVGVVQLGGAIRRKDEGCAIRVPAHHMPEARDRCRIGPVDVVEHEQQRGIVRERRQQGGQSIHEPEHRRLVRLRSRRLSDSRARARGPAGPGEDQPS